MQVILTEDIAKLGAMGELVDVKPGYARNYLLPQNKAVKADPKNMRQLKHQQALIERRKAKLKAIAKNMAERLSDTSITIARKVGEQEKLYGSVTSLDIERALIDEGIELERKRIHLEEPIRSLGVYHVPVKLDSDVEAELKVWVVAE